MKPRIRSLKPEMWADEKIATLSRDARLLLVGLITMADDEGRLRAPNGLICGHVFPYDNDASKRLPGWLSEIERVGLIVRYEHDAKPYVAFRNWRKHQRINRAARSLLPAPPDHDVVTSNSVNDNGIPHDSLTTGSLNDH